jgi:hypothetical protein
MSNLVQLSSPPTGELSLGAAQSRHNKLISFVVHQLQDKVDYGTIQGCGTKPFLFKPGAEKIATLLGFSINLERTGSVEHYTGFPGGAGEPFFKYDYIATVRDRQGIPLANCEGTCNSWEKKYRYRAGNRSCPQCGNTETLLKSKGKPEWFCWSKKGGCGATFPENDPRISSQQAGRVLNSEIFDQLNTLMKMAQKRAMVGAVIVAANATQLFERDTDNIPDPEVIDAEFVDTDKSVFAAAIPSGIEAETPRDRITAIHSAVGWQAKQVGVLLNTYFGAREFDSLTPEEVNRLGDGILTEYAASRCGDVNTARRILETLHQQQPGAWGKDLADMFIIRLDEMKTAVPMQGRPEPPTHRGVSIA